MKLLVIIAILSTMLIGNLFSGTINFNIGSKGLIELQLYSHNSGKYYPRPALQTTESQIVKKVTVDDSDLNKQFSILIARYIPEIGKKITEFAGQKVLRDGEEIDISEIGGSVHVKNIAPLAAANTPGFTDGTFH